MRNLNKVGHLFYGAGIITYGIQEIVIRGSGLILGRKAFQRPFEEGIALLQLVQDVYLDKNISLA